MITRTCTSRAFSLSLLFFLPENKLVEMMQSGKLASIFPISFHHLRDTTTLEPNGGMAPGVARALQS
jgi:hypothetical protein